MDFLEGDYRLAPFCSSDSICMDRNAPIPQNETERLRALESYHIMDTISESEYDSITKLASRICGTPIALISLLDENRQWFKSKNGLETTETSRDISFCQHAILNEVPFVVPNALEDPVFANNPLVTGNLAIRFYAGVPLTDPDGFHLGTLCVIDQKSRVLTEDQLDSLRILAGQVISLLVLRKSKLELEGQKARLEAVFSGLQEGLVEQDITGKIIQCNKSAEEILGLTYEQMIGKRSIDPSWKSIHEDGSDFPGNTHPAMETLRTGKSYSNVIMGVHKPDNQLTWISINSVPLLSTLDQKITGVTCTFKDITNEKKVRDGIAKIKEHDFISKIISKTTDSIVITNTNGEIIWVNRAFEKITEYSFNEVVGKKPGSLLQGEKTDKETVALIRHACYERSEIEVKLLNYTKSKKEYWTNINISPIYDDHGKLEYFIAINRDVTEQLRKEEEKRVSGKRWEFAIENSGDGLWDWDIRSSKVFHSDRWLSMLGYDPLEFGTDLNNWKLLLHPEDEDLVLRELQLHLDGVKDFYSVTHRIKCKDGNYKWVLDSGKVVERSEEGIPLRMIGTIHDLTESREYEKIRLENEKKLNAAQRISKIGSWHFNLENFDLNWSLELYRIFELEDTPKEELYNAYRSKFHPEDLIELDRIVGLAIENGKGYEFQHRIICKDDSIKTILGIGEIELNAEGKPIAISGTAQDITEKVKFDLLTRQKENAWKVTMETVGVGFWDWDIVSDEVIYSDSFNRMLGYEPKEIKSDLDAFRRIVHPDDLANVFVDIQKEINGEVEMYSNEHRARKKDGSLIYILAKGKVIERSEEGKALRMVGTYTDLSKQKENEIAITIEKEKAERASKAKSQFLANMSHEIRTPLNGVIGFTDLLKSTELNDTQMIYTDTLKQSAKLLLDVINDILDFSKIEVGKLDLEIRKTNLGELTSSAIDVVTFQAQSKKLELLLNISPDLPKFIYVDPTRLRQILVNLLSNAIKFTFGGEVTLKVEMLSKNGVTAQFRFSVHDTGMGIEKENLTKIFEAFSQEDNSTSRKFGGTGLGLTISNKLLELMGNSTLKVSSVIGEGSVFSFDLDLKIEESRKEKVLNQQSKRALVLDFSPTTREILKNLLEFHGVHTQTFSSLSDMIRQIESGESIDMIFIDKMISENEATSIIERILGAKNSKINVENIIIITKSIDDDSSFVPLKKLGIKHRLLKPITDFKLMTILNQYSKNMMQRGNGNSYKPNRNLISEKWKVLIVDDNQTNLLLARTLIRKILVNAEIFDATDGLIALEKNQMNTPDIIFMDIQMPNMNGYEAATAIRESSFNQDVYIVALTANHTIEERENCKHYGMDDYLTKPIVPADLERKFLDFMQKRKLSLSKI